MASSLPSLLSRKDVANILSMSVQFITRRERELGLDRARVNTGCRTVRFNRDLVLQALQERNMAFVS